MSLALAASAGLMTATPAHAGPLDFLKNEVSKAAKKEAKRAIEAGTQRSIRVAAGDVTGDGIDNSAAESEQLRQEGGTTVGTADKVLAPEEEGQAALIVPAVQKAHADPRANAKPFRQEGGTTVPTADDVQAPQRPQQGKLSQNGTTVATASEVQAPSAATQSAATQIGKGRSRARASIGTAATRSKLSQNGTTVATASEVQAPQTEGQAGLLLPAVQKVREPARR